MTNSAIANIVRLASLFFGGLFAGFLVTVLVIEVTLRNVDASVYTQVRHVELVWLDNLATATLLPALIATAFLVIFAVRKRRRRILWLTLTALILLVSVLVTTIVFNLPINAEQLNWAVQAPPADWESVRDRWQVAHAVRTGAAVLAFGCLITAAMGTGRHGRSQSCTNLSQAEPNVRHILLCSSQSLICNATSDVPEAA